MIKLPYFNQNLFLGVLLSIVLIELPDYSWCVFPQCAVRAATQGRVLVLEGLEKAERNVLPVLNNLLENREMQLEDGRFLMSAERYDKLLQVREEHLPNNIIMGD